MIALPEDMLEETADVVDAPRVEPVETAPAPDDIDTLRELLSAVKRAVIMADGSRLGAADLDLVEAGDEAEPLNLKAAREDADRKAIRLALARTENNISNAAKLLGVSRPTFYDLIRQYDIDA